MKILILANDAHGLASFRCELIERLVDEGYELVFCVPESASDTSVTSLEGCGARHVHARILRRRGTNPIQDLHLLSFYRSLLRAEHPDIVLTYTIKPNVYGGIACQIEGIPYIANVTGLGTSIQGGGPLQALTLELYQAGLHRAHKVFFQNSANRDFMLSHGVVYGQSDLLPGSGVNTQRFQVRPYPEDNGRVTFLTVGRIMREKGTLDLIEAACAIKPRFPEARFVVVGSFDSNLKDIVYYAAEKGVISYVPPQDDIRPWYESCHALVHPSWHEGMSNVCLEAAAMGRPIIASNVPGCRETFDEGLTGLGFAPRDYESLVSALECFLSIPWERRRDMGLAGCSKVSCEFDRQIVIDKYLEEIESIEREI